MAYRKLTYIFKNSIEYEYHHKGKYGKKGEKRQSKKEVTLEQIAKQNQRNRENRMRRLIKENFEEGDLWVGLQYPEGTRKALEEVVKDLRRFLAKMRRRYKKLGVPFKFVVRYDIGKRGGLHVHVLFNREREGPHPDLLAKSCWPHGPLNYKTIYEKGGYAKLANYITKMPEDDEIQGQMSLFSKKEQKVLLKYSTSRNLVRPKPEVKTYKNRTMKKIIDHGPKATEGFYIDKNSIVQGINPYTGMSYLYYIEYRNGIVPWGGGVP